MGTYIFGVSWPGRSPAGGRLGCVRIVCMLPSPLVYGCGLAH